ncbi:MAG: 23S rRNA (pseudouridine(1915)-N(3))-methyltransferase RlmH [Candidatus Kuenenia sp.]|nr:23S rRNA (pseudouridine(1915)-N(3))-methyltransferase RlmH [Candidatus Kuenenia hertensis]
MKIELIVIGKTEDDYLKKGIFVYTKRLKHYCTFDIVEIPSVKPSGSKTPEAVKEKEAAALEKLFIPTDFVVLLDEKGSEMTSVEFAGFLQQKMYTGVRVVKFVTGGAYGLAAQIKKRANFTLSLSRMTFSHQMVRLFFVEQLYRVLTIIRNEKYHHE